MIPDYPVSRVETYLAAILGQDAALPTPQTRSDLFWANLAGGTWALPAPQSREEIFLAYILGDDSLTLPTPQSRVELFLAKVAGMDVELPEPASREELYLAEWVEEGGGVYRTVSGNPVLFTAKQAAALKSLMIDVHPVQSGTGDPSPDNVRPISGFSAVNVWQAGANVAENSIFYNGAIGSNNGVVVASNTRICTTNFIHVEAGTYTIQTVPELANVIRVYGANTVASFISAEGDSAWQANGRTITFAEDRYIRIMFSYNMGAQTNISPTDLQYLSVSETLTTIPIAIPTPPGTVCGGTLDVLTGELTVTMGQIASYAGEAIGEPWISSMDVYVPGATPTVGAQVVYTLSEPQTYQLTPEEVSTLVGWNTIWSDAGQVTVEYRWN